MHNPPRARTRVGLPAIRDREAYFRAWRTAMFGGDIDPVRVAVEEAVTAFSSGKSPCFVRFMSVVVVANLFLVVWRVGDGVPDKVFTAADLWSGAAVITIQGFQELGFLESGPSLSWVQLSAKSR